MSEGWSRSPGRFGAPAIPSDAPFQPLHSRLAAPAAAPRAEPAVIDPEELQAHAFGLGFEEGRRQAEEDLAGERRALAALAATMPALTPEPSRALALLLSETVDRLVRQVVGEVSIDPALLLARAERCAALIAEETVPGRMRLHPDDLARLAEAELPVERVADPSLKPGTILLETADGWVEDGPDAALEKLRTLLDRIGAPR